MIGISLTALLLAQDAHQHHQPPPEPEPQHQHHQPPPEPQPQHQHEMPADPAADETMDHEAMGHEAMDHGDMDHGDMEQEPDAMAMDHQAMGHDDMSADKLADIPRSPAPQSAGTGPARFAEELFGTEAMQAARKALIHETGGQTIFWFQADRFEARFGGDDVGFLWDAQASYGPDLDKLWIESEGEGDFAEGIESADIEATWSHAIAPFWDLQIGARQDLAGSSRTYFTAGVQGLAPYLFEVDAATYLSSEGDLTAEVEAELDQRITQRLILQPRGEIILAAQDIPEIGLGTGLAALEAGIRLRYEITREFAPYIGFAQEWRVGRSADFARAEGEDVSHSRLVAGIRFWF